MGQTLPMHRDMGVILPLHIEIENDSVFLEYRVTFYPKTLDRPGWETVPNSYDGRLEITDGMTLEESVAIITPGSSVPQGVEFWCSSCNQYHMGQGGIKCPHGLPVKLPRKSAWEHLLEEC
jgi:hypothetical protein